MKILRARTSKGNYVLSLDLNGIIKADEVLSLRGDGAYRKFKLDKSYPIYGKVAAYLSRNKILILHGDKCKKIFLPI